MADQNLEPVTFNLRDAVEMTPVNESGNKNSGSVGTRTRSRQNRWWTAAISLLLAAAAWAGPALCAETQSSRQTQPYSMNQEKDAASPAEGPGILIHVSGQESLASLFRAELEAGFFKHGLPFFSVEAIPELKEKVSMGRTQIKWYEISRLVPTAKARILVFADIEDAGSEILDFYGRETRMTSATFTVRALDLSTGKPVAPPEMGQFRYTSLNLLDSLHRAVAPGADRMGENIKKIWAPEQGN